ncbi:hypothetical protein CMV_000112 [Castanea mollissima]|uniref:Uncharacterized protein n=1 Tax=Castanea mollissima TaxID=60419 RepID=A0A8J4RTU8_9ROSI|nr:hypothetical protein CMV_000112 [Castanea mollissima]
MPRVVDLDLIQNIKRRSWHSNARHHIRSSSCDSSSGGGGGGATNEREEAKTTTGQTLLKALTNTGLFDPGSHKLEDIDACLAECEVNIAQKWLDMLPPRTYDEEYILKRSSRARVMNTHSRLACQVVLTPKLQDQLIIQSLSLS